MFKGLKEKQTKNYQSRILYWVMLSFKYGVDMNKSWNTEKIFFQKI